MRSPERKTKKKPEKVERDDGRRNELRAAADDRWARLFRPMPGWRPEQDQRGGR